jgi:hypothetical protein
MFFYRGRRGPSLELPREALARISTLVGRSTICECGNYSQYTSGPFGGGKRSLDEGEGDFAVWDQTNYRYLNVKVGSKEE